MSTAAAPPASAATESEEPSVLERAARSYQDSVNETARKGIYVFEYVDGPKNGQKITLERQKISIAKMGELEKLRGEYAVTIMRGDSAADGAASGKNSPAAMEARLKSSDLLTTIYSKCAEYYFHISAEDFLLMDWDSSKLNLDAASNVSVFGRPNSAPS